LTQSIPLGPEASAHSARLADHLRVCIAQGGGWISFEHWMHDALYAPGLGYYTAGNIKLASPTGSAPAGDFVTAPQLGALFAKTLASQVAAVLDASQATTVLEFGAGTGALAADMLDALDALGRDDHYHIIEVSPDLRQVQQQRLARFGSRVSWLSDLPHAFSGCVIGNEVLDAMPVRSFAFDGDGVLMERGVAVDAQGQFVWATRAADAALARSLEGRLAPLPGYVSEINLQAEAWMRSMGQWLTRGAALLVDYGFPQSEFYHPQRSGGTLMAHVRHRAHADVLAAPGVQDITAHVDFTAMAQAALDADLDLLGYTAQGRFLMNAGLARHLDAGTDARLKLQMLTEVNTLTSEAEMGELFKVLAVGRGIAPDVLDGFGTRDRRHTL